MALVHNRVPVEDTRAAEWLTLLGGFFHMPRFNKRWLLLLALPIVTAVLLRRRHPHSKYPSLPVAQTLDAKTPLYVRVMSQVLTYP